MNPEQIAATTKALRDLLGPDVELFQIGQLVCWRWKGMYDIHAGTGTRAAGEIDCLQQWAIVPGDDREKLREAQRIVLNMVHHSERVEREWAILGRQAGEIIGLIQGNKELGQMMGIAPGQGILEGLHRWLKEQAE